MPIHQQLVWDKYKQYLFNDRPYVFDALFICSIAALNNDLFKLANHLLRILKIF